MCKISTGSSGMTEAVSQGNKIYFASWKKLYAVSAENCKILWKKKFRETIIPSPVVNRDNILVGTGSSLASLDRQSKKVKWEYRTNGRIVSSPVIYSNKVFFTSSDGFLYVLTLGPGSLLWKDKLSGPSYSRPLIYKNTVIVSDMKGNVRCFALNKD